MNSEITVLSALPSEYATVKALIVQGLTQRWGQYDASFNPDLEDFTKSYQQAVVVIAKIDRLIVGCGILVKETEAVGRIVRMTVYADHPRAGVGSKILIALLNAARAAGYKEVALETTATWLSAVAFYTARGFVPTRMANGDQHFRLRVDEFHALASRDIHL